MATTASSTLFAFATLIGAAAPANSAPPYQPPTLQFTAGVRSATATITNPNDAGICWATISIGGGGGPDDHSGTVAFFGDRSNPASYAQVGQTTTITMTGLEPGPHRVGGFCGTTETTPGQARAEDQAITVLSDQTTPPAQQSIWNQLLAILSSAS